MKTTDGSHNYLVLDKLVDLGYLTGFSLIHKANGPGPAQIILRFPMGARLVISSDSVDLSLEHALMDKP